MMNCRLITFKEKEMCKQPFGLQINHACSAEKPDDMFQIQFKYCIDRTGIVTNNNTPTEVTVDEIIKTVENRVPIALQLA